MINILSGIQSSGAALDAERMRLEVIGQNIANANSTRGPDGQPYRRQQVIFESILQQQKHRLGALAGLQPQSVKVARIAHDPRPFHPVFNPGHPDADAQGMVTMPNVDIHMEMADMLTASRAYEANLAVLKNSKAMALQALAIGKR
jgi:flagellar basal-body rod protein FlgC